MPTSVVILGIILPRQIITIIKLFVFTVAIVFSLLFKVILCTKHGNTISCFVVLRFVMFTVVSVVVSVWIITEPS